MFDSVYLQLLILFFVIFDPLMSLALFSVATANSSKEEKQNMAILAITVALTLSLLVLFFGEKLLILFNTTLDEFKIAGGIILSILGIKMALGYKMNEAKIKNDNTRAIAAIIGTPMLTGPAAITAIILSSSQYGKPVTGLAVLTILLLAGIMLFFAKKITDVLGKTSIQVLSTLLGMVTLAWGVSFITSGLKAIFLLG